MKKFIVLVLLSLVLLTGAVGSANANGGYGQTTTFRQTTYQSQKTFSAPAYVPRAQFAAPLCGAYGCEQAQFAQPAYVSRQQFFAPAPVVVRQRVFAAPAYGAGGCGAGAFAAPVYGYGVSRSFNLNVGVRRGFGVNRGFGY